MSDPIVFVSHQRVNEGKLDGFRELAALTTQMLETDKPGTVFFYVYLNEKETELTIVHVFADADAADAHMEGVAERSQAAAEFTEPYRMELHGTPSATVLEMMNQIAASGVDVATEPEPVAGYTRLSA